MKMIEKEKTYKKMIEKYGDILSKYTIFDIVLKYNNKYDIEKNICLEYIEEIEYNKNNNI